MTHYWFQDLVLDVQLELLRAACERNGRRVQGLPYDSETMEAADDYFNRHNVRQTFPEWFETAEGFKRR